MGIEWSTVLFPTRTHAHRFVFMRGCQYSCDCVCWDWGVGCKKGWSQLEPEPAPRAAVPPAHHVRAGPDVAFFFLGHPIPLDFFPPAPPPRTDSFDSRHWQEPNPWDGLNGGGTWNKGVSRQTMVGSWHVCSMCVTRAPVNSPLPTHTH